MAIRDGIKPLLAGLAIGILTVLGLNKVLASLVYPATWAGVALFIRLRVACGPVFPGSARDQDRSPGCPSDKLNRSRIFHLVHDHRQRQTGKAAVRSRGLKYSR
jgi:hypothetical protein